MSEAPIPTGNAPAGGVSTAPTPPSADQLSALSELTTRMGTMGNDQHEARLRLGEAVHAEISRGGTGWDALNGNPAKLAGEAQHKAMVDQSGEAAPAGATPADAYSSLRPEAFGDHDERQAFGEAMSSAGLDARVVAPLVAGVAGDKRIADAIAAGDAGMDRRVAEVRQFFDRQPGGLAELRLAVAYGDHLASGNPKLAAAWEVAIMSEDALFSLASEARRLGFQPPRK